MERLKSLHFSQAFQQPALAARCVIPVNHAFAYRSIQCTDGLVNGFNGGIPLAAFNKLARSFYLSACMGAV